MLFDSDLDLFSHAVDSDLDLHSHAVDSDLDLLFAGVCLSSFS